MKERWRGRRLAGYVAVLSAATAVAVLAGWTGFASRIDNYAYDFLFSVYPKSPTRPQSAVLAIDEDTLKQSGGMRNVRSIIADALDLIRPARPAAVAIDIVLVDPGENAENAKLEAAMSQTPNLVLASERVGNQWDDPAEVFRRHAAALGHIHADYQARDGVSRQLPLEMTANGQRRWALSLAAFQQARGGPILESPEDLEVRGTRIPAPRRGSDRNMKIRFPFAQRLISVEDIKKNPTLAAGFAGQTVFLGITALTAARDRLINPRGESTPGVEVHRAAFETMAQGEFLVPASDLTVLLVCLVLATAAGVAFWFRSGFVAYGIGIVILIAGHTLPALFFKQGVVFPYFASVSAAWLPVIAAASYLYFTVRRQLRQSETDRARYRQAIHFVTHEMRTPLTAIQGSSELMGRYALSEDKRKQMAQMINSESKRLARMIQTFLDVERLSAGQMELKREPFAARELIQGCLDRVHGLAERKQIQIHSGEFAGEILIGDRELMEYAVYNVLTNAVKYSAAGTEVRVSTDRAGAMLRVSVRDQGMGMDDKELRNIFKKFYRTKKAEASGEAGTGIGLSIVEQIVTQHGGRMEVVSQPGKGSTFTIVLPVHASAATGLMPAEKSI